METELPIMPDNPSKNDKCVWDHKMNDYLKSERVLNGNLHNLFTVKMVLCEIEVKNQIKALPKYGDMDKKLDLTTLLKEIKKIANAGIAFLTSSMSQKKVKGKTRKCHATNARSMAIVQTSVMKRRQCRYQAKHDLWITVCIENFGTTGDILVLYYDLSISKLIAIYPN